MTAARHLCEGERGQQATQGNVFSEPLPAFRLTAQFFPPRGVVRPLKGIRPHPAIERCHLLPTAVALEGLRSCGDVVFEFPLTITSTGILLDGYKRWMIAQERGFQELPCLVLELSGDEALKRILLEARPRRSIGRFGRIELALTLGSDLRQKAKENQRVAGQKKQLTNLSKAEETHVRRETAKLADASEGSVSKVQSILANGVSPLIQKARSGSLSIHGAWKVSRLREDEQLRELGRRSSERRASKRVRALGNAEAIKSDHLSGGKRGLLGEIRLLLDDLTNAAPLEEFRDQSRELLAEMERKLDVFDSGLARSA